MQPNLDLYDVEHPTHPDDARLIDDAIVLLPEIGKCLFASMMRHPRLVGSSVPQIKALGFLAHRAPCTVGDLANGLGIAMATASEAVDRLVERRLVVRTVNPADRRQVMLALTEQGRSLTGEMISVRQRQLRETFARLTAAERTTFIHALIVLADVLRDDTGTATDTTVAPVHTPVREPISDPNIPIAQTARPARAARAPVGAG